MATCSVLKLSKNNLTGHQQDKGTSKPDCIIMLTKYKQNQVTADHESIKQAIPSPHECDFCLNYSFHFALFHNAMFLEISKIVFGNLHMNWLYLHG